MSKQPETKFKEKVLVKLRQVPKSYWIKIQSVAIRGIPDILGVVNGRFVALELKVPPNRLHAGSLQWFTLKALEAAGAVAREVIPDNFDEILEEIKQL
jgi:hypothetical protein